MRIYIERLPDPSRIFGTLYDNVDLFQQSARPQIIITIARYGAWDANVRDRLINAAACATEVMEIQDN